MKIPEKHVFVVNHEVGVETEFARIIGVVQQDCSRLVHCYDHCLRLTGLIFKDGQPAPDDFGSWILAQREINFSKDQNRLPVWGIITKTNEGWKIEISLQMELCW